MYIFVFNWTPTFSGGNVAPPYGLIFASFMVACMGGSSLFTILSRSSSPNDIVRGLTLASAAALAIPMLTENKAVILAAFLVFEGCVGLYWPSIGTVKSRIVPEEVKTSAFCNDLIAWELVPKGSLPCAYCLRHVRHKRRPSQYAMDRFDGLAQM